ncbi:MAG: holin family protein [Paracoccus sp. (in: a-proteobacteria)]|nr:holin family protein [Paracoccus sp. (in: a-proteobacteria)]
MGIISRLPGIGPAATAIGHAATGVAEVFTPNATRRMELDEDAYARAITQHGAEFHHAPAHWFDAFVNGLNRLPRPALALGTLGLFAYAMAEPAGFGVRMTSLGTIPEPLWWLLGAIVSFYFGAREAHYHRIRRAQNPPQGAPAEAAPEPAPAPALRDMSNNPPISDRFADNAALADWAATR